MKLFKTKKAPPPRSQSQASTESSPSGAQKPDCTGDVKEFRGSVQELVKSMEGEEARLRREQEETKKLREKYSGEFSPKSKYTDAQIAMEKKIQEASELAEWPDVDANKMSPARKRASSLAQQSMLGKIESAQRKDEEEPPETDRYYWETFRLEKEKELERVRKREEEAKSASKLEENRLARLAVKETTPKKHLDAQRAMEKLIQEATEFAEFPDVDPNVMTPNRKRAGSQAQQSILNKAEIQRKKEEEEALAAKLEAAQKNARARTGAEKMQNHIRKLSANEQAEKEREMARLKLIYEEERARAMEAEFVRIQKEEEASRRREEQEERRKLRAAQVSPTQKRHEEVAIAVQKQIDEAIEFAEFPDYDPNTMTPSRKRAGSLAQQNLADQITVQRRQTMENQSHAKAQEAFRKSHHARLGQEKMTKKFELLSSEEEREAARETAEYDRIYEMEMARLMMQRSPPTSPGGSVANPLDTPTQQRGTLTPVVDRAPLASPKMADRQREIALLEHERVQWNEGAERKEKQGNSPTEMEEDNQVDAKKQQEWETMKGEIIQRTDEETRVHNEEEQKNREEERAFLASERGQRTQEERILKAQETREADESEREETRRLEERWRKEEEEDRIREEKEDEEIRLKEEQLRRREEELTAMEKLLNAQLESSSMTILQREKTPEAEKQASYQEDRQENTRSREKHFIEQKRQQEVGKQEEEEELRLMRERDLELTRREQALSLLEAEWMEIEKRQQEEDEDFLRQEEALRKREEEIMRLERCLDF